MWTTARERGKKMLLRILRNDLKRKKTMNTILFMFVVLATIFVSSGLNNVITVLNGTDYYLEKAGIGDYILVTSGKDATRDMLETNEAVESYTIDNGYMSNVSRVTLPSGEEATSNNVSIIIHSIDEVNMNFFDINNEEITEVEPGHVYFGGDFISRNGLEEGDIITFTEGDIELELIVSGHVKDALFGSDFMGNVRMLLNEEQIDELQESEEFCASQIQISSIITDNPKEIKKSISDIDGVLFDGTKSLIKTTYVMEIILAFVVLILSVCLIIVAFVVLKFTITFTISEEFREIGVMKAIGLSNRRIRSLYIIKYLAMSIAGGILGFFLSIPFGRMLMNSVSRKMYIGNDNGLLMNIIGAVIVVLVINLYAYHCTGKVRNSTPVDAIRNGQTGERYSKKSVLRIKNFPGRNEFFMAFNDVLSNPKRYITIMLSFGICTLFVLLLVNTTATMRSDRLISTIATKTDLYIGDNNGPSFERISQLESSAEGEEIFRNYLSEFEQKLEDAGIPGNASQELFFKYSLEFEGNTYSYSFAQGIDTNFDSYEFLEGVAPAAANEVAITQQISDLTGLEIGDSFILDTGNDRIECIVTAYFQTMNQMGEVIRLHEDAPRNMQRLSSFLGVQIDFYDDPDAAEIEARKDIIAGFSDYQTIENAAEYVVSCTRVVDTLEVVQYLLLAITLVVVALVTILMERSFISNEKSQIAILKAIGFTDKAIIKWHVIRLGFVSLAAVTLAAILSIPATDLIMTPVFGIMGAKTIDYLINPLNIFVIYPGIILLMTLLVTYLTALYTKTIKSSDTANIE